MVRKKVLEHLVHITNGQLVIYLKSSTDTGMDKADTDMAGMVTAVVVREPYVSKKDLIGGHLVWQANIFPLNHQVKGTLN